MAEYPEALTVGTPPYQETYLLQPDQLLLRFGPDAPDELIDEIVLAEELETLSLRPAAGGNTGPDNLRAAKMRWVLAPQGFDTTRDAADDLARQYPELLVAGPVYLPANRGEASAAAPVTDAIVVRPVPGVDAEALVSSLVSEELGLTLNETMSGLLAPFLYLHVPPFQANDEDQILTAFDLLEPVAGIEGVALVSLDWIRLYPWQLVPSDTWWPEQWGLARIGAEAAWDLQTGAGDVWIAVLDWGFDLAHPDLAYTPDAPPAYTHFNIEEFFLGQPPPYDAGPDHGHGTAVAGIAAATLDNATGIAGLAGGCPVMPIRLGPAPTASKIAAGLTWAAARGARVGNMSFGVDPTPDFIEAVERAWDAGMVLCAATGNGAPDPVEFPANHARTIAVGASDQDDQRKRPDNTDAECWGSQFGPELDVVAPGVLCWTTDISGAGGYNANAGGPMTGWSCVDYPACGDEAGEYFALSNGTSAATPHVAGLAALLISRFPTLTNQQVRDIIERTCEKVGPYTYTLDPSRPNGDWHEEMGYGRISAVAALQEADAVMGTAVARASQPVSRRGGPAGPRPW